LKPKPIMLLCLQLKELSHNNIVPFIGACIEPQHVCFLMQYCNRGTVQVQ